MAKEVKEVRSLKALNERKVLLNLDKIGADNHIVSIELTEDVRNGSIVKLGDYQGQDYYKGVKATDLANDRLVLIAASILPYDEIRTRIEDVVLRKGERVRAYVLKRGDMITLTNDQINGETTIGQFVVPEANKYELKANATKEACELNFVVIAKENLHGFEASVLEVI